MSKKKKRQSGEMRGFNHASSRLHLSLSGMLSNIRLSLTFRIAMHYCWQLLRTTLAAALIVTVAYWAMHVVWVRQTVEALETAPGVGQEILVSGGFGLRRAALVEADHLPELPQVDLVNVKTLRVTAHHMSGSAVQAELDLSYSLMLWGALMLALALSDLYRMASFIRRRQRLDKRVLAPIRDMTEMAATLSASNLSNRINIAGTKDELKDLAIVINTMLDRIERSYNSQKQFVSDASHELRTPIAVIQGYVRMLQRWGKDDPTVLEEGIAAIAQETASMKELVESLLFLARHDKKTLMMELESFDPSELLTELHREAEMVTPQDQFVVSAAEECTIEGDRGMIKQVMRILIDNAVKYTSRGGRITLGVRKAVDGCVLTVQDNGPGIPQEELPKVFDRFYRSDSARKSESSGHGLGLSIARIIVIAHGGKLRVRSMVGVGTVFSIELPARQSRLHTAQLTDQRQA